MTLAEIITELKTAELPPKAALTAAVAHADALAPAIYFRVEKLCASVHLMPQDQNLLFYGLHILAAARHEGLWPRLLDLARLKDGELEQLFPGRIDITLARMMLSVWDGDADAIFRLIEHADMIEDAKWGLFDVAARLTFDGRIERRKTLAFLSRFAAEGLAEPDSRVWWGWEHAVTRLGIVQLEAELLELWQMPAYATSRPDDRTASLEQLHWCAQNPRDPGPFDESDVRAIDDPVEALAWIDRRIAAVAAFDARVAKPAPEIEPEIEIDDDPAKASRLSPDELQWLAHFLTSRQVPATSMTLEMLDGFLTALVIGPSLVPSSEYLPVIWGEEGSAGVTWDGPEQAEFTLDLFTRHCNAIAARRLADAPHRPVIDNYDDDSCGSEWSDGFLTGIDLRAKEWELMWDHPRGEDHLFAIAALCDYGGAEDGRDDIPPPLTKADRASTIVRLPLMLKRIAAFWMNPDKGFRSPAPVRVTKIGRNDPCPCGSGQKYKKCCALKPPPLMH